jgi:hypothetical protein
MSLLPALGRFLQIPLGITTQGCLSMMVSMLSCRYSPIVFKILARLSPKN